ncbi:hypothetical protein JCM1840_007684 [Sporobolomyces johnsonii]
MAEQNFDVVLCDEGDGPLPDLRFIMQTQDEADRLLADAEIAAAVKAVDPSSSLMKSPFPACTWHDHLALFNPRPSHRRWGYAPLDPHSPSFAPRPWLDTLEEHATLWRMMEDLLPRKFGKITLAQPTDEGPEAA